MGPGAVSIRVQKTEDKCCFNEKILYDNSLVPDSINPPKLSFKHKYLWVTKATGLGVTFVLRVMVGLSAKDGSWSHTQTCIVTGPNMEMETRTCERYF